MGQALNRKLVASIMLCSAALTIAIPTCAHEKFHRLTAMEIRTHIIGKVITDESHWADQYQTNGVMGGHQLGQPQTGSWILHMNGAICVIRKVRNSESDCFDIWLNHNQVQYRRDGILLSEGILKNE